MVHFYPECQRARHPSFSLRSGVALARHFSPILPVPSKPDHYSCSSLGNLPTFQPSDFSAFFRSIPAISSAFSVDGACPAFTPDLQSSTVDSPSLIPFPANVDAASSISPLFVTLTKNTGGGVSLFLSVFYRVARSLWMRAGGPIEP